MHCRRGGESDLKEYDQASSCHRQHHGLVKSMHNRKCNEEGQKRRLAI